MLVLNKGLLTGQVWRLIMADPKLYGSEELTLALKRAYVYYRTSYLMTRKLSHL